jgi:hypothetical protein
LCGRSARVVRDSWTSASSPWGCGAPRAARTSQRYSSWAGSRPWGNCPSRRWSGIPMSRPARCASIQSVPRGARTGQAPLQVRQKPGKGRPASTQANRAPHRPQASVTVPRAPGNVSATCTTAGRFRPSASSRFLSFAQRQVASLRGRVPLPSTVETGTFWGHAPGPFVAKTTRS